MNAHALIEVAADYMAALRALNRMRRAGFTLYLDGSDLLVSPFSKLTSEQRAFLRSHKAALVQLLNDAETLYAAHLKAGVVGLAGREGVPRDWTDSQWLAASQLLHSDRRIKTVLDRRYCPASAPAVEECREYHPPANVDDSVAQDALLSRTVAN